MKISRHFQTILLTSTMVALGDNYTSSKMETVDGEDEVRVVDMEKKAITKGSVSIEEQNLILRIHHASRSQVQATNMMKMRYYADIAEKAQLHADSCAFRQDLSINRKVSRLGGVLIGQNICMGLRSWFDCIYSWINEKNNFVYGIGSNNGGEIGYYTQLMLWRTMAIGCGFNSCNGTAFHVCNYAYGQHINERKTPWKIGSPCTDCPNNCAADGFCDCGGKVCSNIYMVPSPTCQCMYWWVF